MFCVTIANEVNSLTIETFNPFLESDFRARLEPDGLVIDLRLIEVRPLGRQPNAPRAEPFALVFAGPAQPRLEQRIYGLDHDRLGSIEIFLVPIGFDPGGGLLYEAVFN